MNEALPDLIEMDLPAQPPELRPEALLTLYRREGEESRRHAARIGLQGGAQRTSISMPRRPCARITIPCSPIGAARIGTTALLRAASAEKPLKLGES